MSEQVLVVAETMMGEIKDITFVLLAAGRQIADALHGELTVLLMGRQTRSLAPALGKADRVLCLDDPALAEFNPEAFLLAASAVLEARRPRVTLLGHTAIGSDLACGLSLRQKLPVVTSCQSFPVRDGQVYYSALTCGGKILASGPLPGPACLATVMSGGYKPDQGKSDRAVPVEVLPPPAGLDAARTRFRQYRQPELTDVDITKEPILVSVGRGIQNKENLAIAEGLAKSLGGVVSGSRPVVDQGWLPTSRLVGKSGKQVKPKLYLAVGISGSPEHLEGVPEAETIIAINTDAKAPIFDVAHYGTTCDALELMPALAERLAKCPARARADARGTL
jgi:electron transfer flavoprotein alpha subunit